MKEVYEILNWYTGYVQVSVEIDCSVDDTPAVKLGLAVKVAIINGADLRYADLRYADLRGAILSNANLSNANLSNANLSNANLSNADLSNADLSGADLRGAIGIDLVIARTRILPEGSIIGWKKCKNDVIVKLRVPEEAKRSSAFGRKCRAEFVDVLEIFGGSEAISSHDGATIYKVGERVYPDSFSEDWMAECSSGIHFFITREEAENY